MSKSATKRFEAGEEVLNACVMRIDRRTRPVCVNGLPWSERNDGNFCHELRVFFRPCFISDVLAFERTAEQFSDSHVYKNPYGYSLDQSWADRFEVALIQNMIAMALTPGQCKKIKGEIEKHQKQFEVSERL